MLTIDLRLLDNVVPLYDIWANTPSHEKESVSRGLQLVQWLGMSTNHLFWYPEIALTNIYIPLSAAVMRLLPSSAWVGSCR